MLAFLRPLQISPPVLRGASVNFTPADSFISKVLTCQGCECSAHVLSRSHALAPSPSNPGHITTRHRRSRTRLVTTRHRGLLTEPSGSSFFLINIHSYKFYSFLLNINVCPSFLGIERIKVKKDNKNNSSDISAIVVADLFQRTDKETDQNIKAPPHHSL